MSDPRHFRVAMQIQDEGQPVRWAWATFKNWTCKFATVEEAGALASYGGPEKAKVIEIPAGWQDPDLLLRIANN